MEPGPPSSLSRTEEPGRPNPVLYKEQNLVHQVLYLERNLAEPVLYLELKNQAAPVCYEERTWPTKFFI